MAGFHARFAHRFGRSEPRERALDYLSGLLAPLERKNGWTMSEQVGQARPDSVQRLLNHSAWDEDAVRDDVRAYVVETIGAKDGILIGDDTGYGPVGTRLKGLVKVAAARWAVEESFQVAKNECGLDHYQVRLYRAWYRHITLAMAALAYLTAVRAEEAAKGAEQTTGKS
ncbi:transposase [Streptomyces sp. NPDC001250]|uniref:transposase n=1 Tax=Streptomyces sp. NPDC001250 TaxID=3154382 RepID=UPI0033227194